MLSSWYCAKAWQLASAKKLSSLFSYTKYCGDGGFGSWRSKEQCTSLWFRLGSWTGDWILQMMSIIISRGSGSGAHHFIIHKSHQLQQSDTSKFSNTFTVRVMKVKCILKSKVLLQCQVNNGNTESIWSKTSKWSKRNFSIVFNWIEPNFLGQKQ